MTAPRIRVWVEEVQPPNVLLFTWKLPEDEDLDPDEAFATVLRSLEEADGVKRAEPSDEGVEVEIDPDATTRYKLASAIRSGLAPDDPEANVDPTRTRVWAEDLASNKMRLTWFEPDKAAETPEPEDRRAVAARLAVTQGVKSAYPDPEGVLITYEPERLDRGGLAEVVRTSLGDRRPLRDRADELLKRAPTYGNLARKLAMDDRVSPLPDAAKQAIASRGAGGSGRNVAARTALRFVPGAVWITRIQTLLPMLTELSKWSREADPEIVDQHLASVGLDREMLRADTITAHEIKLFARDSAFETGAEIGEKASAGARQAISAGRGFVETIRESIRENARENSDDDDGSDAEAGAAERKITNDETGQTGSP
ncbi:MAG: hypothetical protein R2849_02875 [Thermomicrobiales bacterium]